MDNLIKKASIAFGIIFLIVLGFILSGLYSFKKSEAYLFAKDYVMESSEVNDKIGGVVDFGFMVGGTIEPAKAHLSFSVEGKKRDVGVILDLIKDRGEWEVEKLSYY